MVSEKKQEGYHSNGGADMSQPMPLDMCMLPIHLLHVLFCSLFVTDIFKFLLCNLC
jgi:hypothetical protein